MFLRCLSSWILSVQRWRFHSLSRLSVISIPRLFVTSRSTVTFEESCRIHSSVSQDPHDEMLFYFGFNWWYFQVKRKEMLMINLILIYCIHASTFFSIIRAYQPFSVTHKNTEPPHHSLSLSRSHFSILLFGNPILEFITLDAAAPFLSSFAIRMSKWYDLSATQYILSTEATDIVQIHSKGLWHVQSFYKKKTVENKSYTRAVYVL